MNKLIFCYGSNYVEQLEHRLERKIKKSYPAYLPDYQRVFRGYSQKWKGGIASVQKKRGKAVFGLVIEVDSEDLKKLDIYEGYPDVYNRKELKCEVDLSKGFESKKCIVYVYVLGNDFNEPSKEYLKAIYKTIGTHWEVNLKDIDIN
jgi:gamma-glutamylcyclotransferase (GGCT)/AIG2-like uncharacterized protein YtfP